MELEAYLKLNRASLEEWQEALRRLSDIPALECHLQCPESSAPVGALSLLESPVGSVICLQASRPMIVKGWHSSTPVWIRVLNGAMQSADDAIPFAPGDARSPGSLAFQLSAGSQVALVIPREFPGEAEGEWRRGSRSRICALFDRFLFQVAFARSHAHSVASARKLIQGLIRHSLSEEGVDLCCVPSLDRRLQRAIEKIEQESDWEFDLPQLARHSGVSERNLYYLMRRETGLTPYRFYQRCRLIRVRRRLVDCQCEIPHISWYAADEGFSHLGRFAALYREHFGELPSQTVQWRRSLLDTADEFA
ncbi:AraC family transcriptional regulator [Marinobacter santoriniensis]|uniref:AraC family transcriptional regulator n=1 Tax=Marinobacter santoriniensis TaxID=523742 RepID=UPI00034D6BE5|nr:helix-turn-helix domain-containing protein [Marinobacter santoriniensis]